MGKYMRKAKITCDVAVMEVVSQSSLGVRTRAKTLALQRLQSTTTQAPSNPESSYLQLRSRRLEKVLPPLFDPKKQQSSPQEENPNPNPSTRNRSSRMSSRLRPTDSSSVRSVSMSCSKNEVGFERECRTGASQEDETEDHRDLTIEPSFGENNLDFDGRGRGTRESTPCSFLRDPVTAGTPGSTTRQTSSTATNQRTQNATHRSIPTTQEMEEFFACAEKQQQNLFVEKYNFDVVNDMPLPGRYEWVRVEH